MNRMISIVYVIAGLTNILGICIASRLFTDPLFFKLYPTVFNDFGAFLVIVWGLLYISVARVAPTLGPLALVFSFQKGIYAYTWVLWVSSKWDMIDMIRRQSELVGWFYASYGAVSLSFALFFLWVGLRALTK